MESVTLPPLSTPCSLYHYIAFAVSKLYLYIEFLHPMQHLHRQLGSLEAWSMSWDFILLLEQFLSNSCNMLGCNVVLMEGAAVWVMKGYTTYTVWVVPKRHPNS